MVLTRLHGTRFTDMPELPEVETVKRELEKTMLNKTFLTPQVYFKGAIKSDYETYLKEINNKTVVSFSRKGKFLLINLNDKQRILFHLRMEGKLFVVDKKEHSTKHLTLFIPFKDDDNGLAFYDVRKFGITQLLKENELGPLKKLGLEPFEIQDPTYLYDKLKNSNKTIKELLLDQSIIAGIGNIYDSEILFKSSISPFRKGKTIRLDECQTLINISKDILNKAIINNGSTIRSYQASQKVHGSFQEFLQVYQNDGYCKSCHSFKIQKIAIEGRGTYFCPKCQHTGITLGITGKIGSGKSLATSFFKDDGYLTISSDDIVHSLYKNESFLKKLKANFPMVFKEGILSKDIISNLLQNDNKFKNKYQNFIFKEVKKEIENFIIENDSKNKAVEVPLLFDAHFESLFTYLVGVETIHQKEHLLNRGETNIEERIKFNSLNSYDENKEKLDFILHSDSTIEYLHKQVDDIVIEIEKRLA